MSKLFNNKTWGHHNPSVRYEVSDSGGGEGVVHVKFLALETVIGDISYHTPKDGLVQPKHILRASLTRRRTTSRSLWDIWQTDCKPSTARTSFLWPPFSANTITFTYHPLFELFFPPVLSKDHNTYTHTHTQHTDSLYLSLSLSLSLYGKWWVWSWLIEHFTWWRSLIG